MDISVIIPTLNEERVLARAIASVSPFAAEVLVVDGGSIDRTLEVAAAAGSKILRAPPGRGTQMNCGARAAAGDILLFLHADCALVDGAAGAVRLALSDPSIVVGCFALRVDSPAPALRWVGFGSNLRARWLGLPYGDQALFVRRVDFESAGGYRELPLMEDVDLVLRLRRRGRIACLRETVTTLPRHWESRGPTWTTLVNWSAVLLFLAGVSAERLAPLYWKMRGIPSPTNRLFHPSATPKR
jgi:rSAM/selenodomain-associated transferase 2